MDAWCQAIGLEPGVSLDLEKVWALSQAWYGDRLSPTWEPRSVEATQSLLQNLGLTGPFWDLAAAV